jgi:hypothetical protein
MKSAALCRSGSVHLDYSSTRLRMTPSMMKLGDVCHESDPSALETLRGIGRGEDAVEQGACMLHGWRTW